MSDFETTSILPLLAEDAAAKPVLNLPLETEPPESYEFPGYKVGFGALPETPSKRKYPFDELPPPVDGKAAYFGVPRTEKTLGRLYSAVHNREKHHPGEKYKVVPAADSVRVYRLA